MNFSEFNWKDDYEKYIAYLKNISEDKYREFNKRITPTKYEMLGIRLPILRKIAKDIFKGDYKSFLEVSNNAYFEEVLIKGLVIAKLDDVQELEEYFDSFVGLIDNWAICDTFCNSLKIVGNNKEYFLKVIDKLILRQGEYQVRVGLILLLGYYVEEAYLEVIYNYVLATNSTLYYVNMARAWLLCEVFVKFPKQTLEFLENETLDKFTINKTISKIRDSYRVDKGMKDYILKFRK